MRCPGSISSISDKNCVPIHVLDMDGIIPASVSGTSKGRLPCVRAAPGRKQEKRERAKERIVRCVDRPREDSQFGQSHVAISLKHQALQVSRPTRSRMRCIAADPRSVDRHSRKKRRIRPGIDLGYSSSGPPQKGVSGPLPRAPGRIPIK
jgi:hypothetical protein